MAEEPCEVEVVYVLLDSTDASLVSCNCDMPLLTIGRSSSSPSEVSDEGDSSREQSPAGLESCWLLVSSCLSSASASDSSTISVSGDVDSIIGLKEYCEMICVACESMDCLLETEPLDIDSGPRNGCRQPSTNLL